MNFDIDFEHICLLIFVIAVWACFKNICMWVLTHDVYASFLNKFSASDAQFLDYVCQFIAYIFMLLGTTAVGTFVLVCIDYTFR